MRAEYLLTEPLFWIIPWVLHAAAYFFVLKKMGLKSWTALIPFAAEHELTTVLFNKTRAFWRLNVKQNFPGKVNSFFFPR